MLETVVVASGDGPVCAPGFGCDHDGGGVVIGLSQHDARQLAQELPPQPPGTPRSAPALWYEFLPVADCPGNGPDQDDYDSACEPARQKCESYDLPGPYSLIWRRQTDARGPRGSWSQRGFTCFPADVPPSSGPGGDEDLTALALEAFNRTPFARGVPGIQPPGGRTLVNVETFFASGFAKDGYDPGETNTVQLGGHQVRIRPSTRSFTYRFGDGAAQGPTTDPGGRYPNGRVRHVYTTKGTVNPRLDITYTGYYSIDGSPWRPVPGEVTITGEPVTLQVLTARSRLVQR